MIKKIDGYLAEQFKLAPEHHAELMSLLFAEEQKTNKELKRFIAKLNLTPYNQNKLRALLFAKKQKINGEFAAQHDLTLDEHNTPITTSTTNSLYQYYCLYVFIHNRNLFDQCKTAIYQATNSDEAHFENLKKTVLLSEADKALLARLSESDLWILRTQGKRSDHEIILLLGNPPLLKKMLPYLDLKNFLPSKNKTKNPNRKLSLTQLKNMFSFLDLKKLLLSKKKVETANKRLGLLLAYHKCSNCRELEFLEKILKKYGINPTETPTQEAGIDQEILVLQEKYECKYNKLGFWDAVTINATFDKNLGLESHLLAEIFELRKLLLSEKEKPARVEKDREEKNKHLEEMNNQWTEFYENEKQKEHTDKKAKSISFQPAEKNSFTKTHEALQQEFSALFKQPQITEQDWKKATNLAQKTYFLYEGFFKPSPSKKKTFPSKKEAATSLLHAIITKIEENSSPDTPKKEYQITNNADGDRNSTRLTDKQKTKLTAEAIKKRIPRMRTV